MPPTIDFRFVQSAAGEIPNSQDDSQRTQLRSHASRMGYRNARHDKGRRPQAVSTNVLSLSLAGQFNISGLQSKFRVTVRPKPKTDGRFIHESGKDTRALTRNRSTVKEYEVAQPSPLLSADINCPHYLYIWSQQLFPNESIFHKCFNIHDVQTVNHIRPYLEYRVFQTTMNAVSHAIYGILGPGNRSISKPYIYSLRGEAISMLRQSLHQHDLSGGVILSILYLVLLEMLLGEYQASDMHRANLGQIVAQQGLESMDEHVICCILQQNQYWLDNGIQPILPPASSPAPLEYPSIPLTSSLQLQVDSLPKGFRRLAIVGGISISNLCILFRVHNVHLDLQMDKTQLRLDPFVLDENHHYRTLLDACPVLKTPDAEDSIFQKILCWTLLIYSMIYLGNANAVSPLPLSARRDLTTRLMHLPQQRLRPAEECVLWMWHVAVHSWRGPSGQVEGDGQILLRMRRNRFKLSKSRTDEVLQQFSWNSKMISGNANTDLLKQLDVAQEIIDLRPDKHL